MEMGMVMGKGRRAERESLMGWRWSRSHRATACRVLYALAEEGDGRSIGRWLSETPLSIMDWNHVRKAFMASQVSKPPRYNDRPDGFPGHSLHIALTPKLRAFHLSMESGSKGCWEMSV